MSLSITQQSLEIVAQNKNAQDLMHRGELQPIVNDIQNIIATAGTGAGTGNVNGSGVSVAGTLPIVNNITTTALVPSLAAITAAGSINIPTGQTYSINGVPIGTGNVTGGATSADGEIARYNLTTGKIIKASATPVIVSDAGDVSLPAGGTVTASTVRAISASNLSLIADSNGKVIINDNGNLGTTAIGLDFTGMGGYVAYKAGAVGGVAFGFAANRGFYDGTTQINVAVGGALVAAFDASGVKIDVITEKTGGAGVTFASQLKADTISATGIGAGNFAIDNTGLGTVGITSEGSMLLTTLTNGNIALTIDGTGQFRMNGNIGLTKTLAQAIADGDQFINGILVT